MEQQISKNSNHLKWSPLEEDMRAYARTHHVPIIVDEGLALLEQIIRIKKPKNILEIGSAIGYSAIRMHQVCKSRVYTIERDKEMIVQAEKNILASGYQEEIKLIACDALDAYDCVKDIPFDMIFIDAAKAQYTKFFEIYTPLLTSNGVVVTDNMSFHGLVDSEDYLKQSRSVRGLIRKLTSYRNFLLENPKFATSIVEIGDGIAISVKKDEYEDNR